LESAKIKTLLTNDPSNPSGKRVSLLLSAKRKRVSKLFNLANFSANFPLRIFRGIYDFYDLRVAVWSDREEGGSFVLARFASYQ